MLTHWLLSLAVALSTFGVVTGVAADASYSRAITHDQPREHSENSDAAQTAAPESAAGGYNGTFPCIPKRTLLPASVTRLRAPGTFPPEPDHGLNVSQFRAYWSRDKDYSRTDILGSTVTNRALLHGALACSDDITFQQPPAVGATWNEPEHDNFTGEPDERSVFPRGADRKNGTLYEDAYIEVMSVSPSTVAHWASRNTTERYIRSSGTLRAVVDYRFTLGEHPTVYDYEEYTRSNTLKPYQEVRDSGIFLRFYSLENQSVVSTLYADGRPVDTAAGPRPEFNYTNVSGTTTFRVETTLTAAIEREQFICPRLERTEDGCEDDVSGNYEYDWVNQSLTVSDSVTATVQNLSGATRGELGDFPNGTRVYVNISQTQPWYNATFPGLNGTVTSTREFYTRSPDQWSQWQMTNGSHTWQVSARARPLQSHSTPARCNAFVEARETGEPQLRNTESFCGTETAPDSRSLRLTQLYGPTGPSPTFLQLGIDLAAPVGVRDTRGFVVAGNQETTDSRVQLTGIVRGYSETVDVTGETTVGHTTMNVTVASRSGEDVTFTGSASGPPIRPLTGGNVTLTSGTLSSRASAGSGFSTELTVTEAGAKQRVVATYRPQSPKWWKEPTPVTPARATTTGYTKFTELWLFIEVAIVTVLWFVPVGLLLLGVDYASGGRLLGVVNT